MVIKSYSNMWYSKKKQGMFSKKIKFENYTIIFTSLTLRHQ